jgi:hypothetical protein
VVGSSTVDEVDSYCVELVGHNGITTLNIICFLLHDYSLKENILLVIYNTLLLYLYCQTLVLVSSENI